MLVWRRWLATGGGGGGGGGKSKKNWRPKPTNATPALEACTTLAELESILTAIPPTSKMSPWECSTAILKLGKMQSRNQLLISKVLEKLQLATPESSSSSSASPTPTQRFKPWHLTNICYGIAKGKLARRIPGEVEAAVRSMNFDECDARGLGNMVWSFAKLKQFGLFDRFEHELVERRSFAEFEPQGIANTMWAFAERGQASAALLAKLDDRGVRTSGFKPVDVSIVFWSLAVLSQASSPPPAILRELSLLMQSQPSLAQYSMQALSNILWSCAKLELHGEQELVRTICNELHTRDLALWAPQDFSNTVWALGQLAADGGQYVPVLLLGKISMELKRERRMESFSNLALASLLDGFARCSHRLCCEPIADELVHRRGGGGGKSQYPPLSPSTMASLLWSFEVLNFQDHRVCALVVGELLADGATLLSQCSPQDLSQITIKLARFDFRHDEFLQQVAKEVVNRGGFLNGGFSGQAVLNLLWAFACLDVLHLPEVAAVFTNQRVDVAKQNDHTREQAHQLVQTLLAWKQHTGGEDLSSPLLQSLATTVDGEEAWYLRFLGVEASSQTHAQVSAQLAQCFPDLRNEHAVAHGLFVDIFLPQSTGHGGLAIELDGPSHFFHNTQQPGGRTKFKHRLVRGTGTRLVSLKTQDLRTLEQDDLAKALQAVIE